MFPNYCMSKNYEGALEEICIYKKNECPQLPLQVNEDNLDDTQPLRQLQPSQNAQQGSCLTSERLLRNVFLDSNDHAFLLYNLALFVSTGHLMTPRIQVHLAVQWGLVCLSSWCYSLMMKLFQFSCIFGCIYPRTIV